MPDDLWNLTHPWLRDLKGYVPGKPIEDVARELGLQPEQIDKLASNENPLGPSPKALAAMAKVLPIAHLYPDGGAYYLREALAKRAGLERANVLLGTGSNELLELVGHAFMSPGDEVVMARHSFMIYKLVTQLFGATAVEVPDPGFAHDLPAMAAAITDRTRVVYVTNPSNPTGTLATQDELDDFMCMVPERVVVVFDEAYYEFLEQPPQTIPYIRAGRNVLVLRTFSKAQGLAAMRPSATGFAPAALAEVIERTRQPFNTSGIAQAGALASLDDEEHVRKRGKWRGRARAFRAGVYGHGPGVRAGLGEFRPLPRGARQRGLPGAAPARGDHSRYGGLRAARVGARLRGFAGAE